MKKESEQTNDKSVRIDKWLWAARFFKTRSLAKQAIEGGKVHVNGQRAKPSRDIQVGMALVVRQGWDDKEIIVQEITDKRRGAPDAVKLYEETQESINKRLTNAQQRKAMGAATINTEGKPTGKQRRKINELKRQILSDT